MFQLVACYSFPSCSPDLALFLSIPGSLVADWCVILIRSFCAARESITLSVNGWSTVGGGSTKGSLSLSSELYPLTAHLPDPLHGVIFIINVIHPLMWISGVFFYFPHLFLLAG